MGAMGRNDYVGLRRLQMGRLFIHDNIGVIVWATLSVGAGYLGGMLLADYPLLALVVGVVIGSLVWLLIQKLQAWLFEWKDLRYGVSAL